MPERTADAAVHAASVVFTLAAVAGLVFASGPGRETGTWMAAWVYAAGLILMVACSALYNLTSNPTLSRLFRRFDHAAIFFMIAGTYTPFSLVAIGGSTGISLLLFIWVVALAGAAMKLISPARFERSSIAVYLLLGWTGLTVINSLLASLSVACLVLLGIGGALYSLGVVFHLWTRLPYHTALWHGFVLGGAACHYAAVLRLLPALPS